jgi:hypothetical protein
MREPRILTSLRAAGRGRRPWYMTARLGALGAPVAFGLVAVGLLAIGLTWYKASGTVYLPEQIAYLASGATVGIAFVALGVGMLISSTARDDAAGTQELLVRILDAVERLAAAAAPHQGGARVVWRVGDTAHVPGCLAVDAAADREVLVVDATPPEGLSACELCLPWQPQQDVVSQPTRGRG